MDSEKAKSNSDYTHIEGVLQTLQAGREELEDLWSLRKLKLDLCLQLRLFEREALEVITTVYSDLLPHIIFYNLSVILV